MSLSGHHHISLNYPYRSILATYLFDLMLLHVKPHCPGHSSRGERGQENYYCPDDDQFAQPLVDHPKVLRLRLDLLAMRLCGGLQVRLRFLRHLLNSRAALVVDGAAGRHHLLALPDHLLVLVADLQRRVEELLEYSELMLKPDQVGFGKSSKPVAYQFSFQALAANTRSLLVSLRVEKFALVGHSMGGMLAARMTLMYPDRVERLALVNPIGLEDWKLAAPYRTVEENFAQELRATPESIKEYQRVNYFGGEWRPEFDALTEILSGWTRHPQHRRVAWNAALTSDMIFTQPVIYEFERLRSPTLLIIGQRDRTAIGKDRVPKDVAATMGDYPSLGKAAAQRIPGARLVEIAEAGHLPQVDSFPKYARTLLDFIAGG